MIYVPPDERTANDARKTEIVTPRKVGELTIDEIKDQEPGVDWNRDDSRSSEEEDSPDNPDWPGEANTDSTVDGGTIRRIL